MLLRSTWARAGRALETTVGRATRRWAERILWLALIAFIGVRIWPQIAAAAGVASADAAAPRFALTTLDGNPVTSGSLAGKVVLLNFRATWCPPCRLEMPGFQRGYDLRLMPTSFLIDRDGRIRNEVTGLFASIALEQAVGRLLREPASASARGVAR